MHGPVLHLPDVAELVRHQVLRGVRAPEQDRPDQRVAVVAAQARQAEEPGRDDEPDASGPYWTRIERECVEPRLRARQARIGQEPTAGGVSTRTGLPSGAAWNWNA